VIENDVGLQVKVWTGDAFYSPKSFNPRRANYALLQKASPSAARTTPLPTLRLTA
jgi:hypothetical protein